MRGVQLYSCRRNGLVETLLFLHAARGCAWELTIIIEARARCKVQAYHGIGELILKVVLGNVLLDSLQLSLTHR